LQQEPTDAVGEPSFLLAHSPSLAVADIEVLHTSARCPAERALILISQVWTVPPNNDGAITTHVIGKADYGILKPWPGQRFWRGKPRFPL